MVASSSFASFPRPSNPTSSSSLSSSSSSSVFAKRAFCLFAAVSTFIISSSVAVASGISPSSDEHSRLFFFVVVVFFGDSFSRFLFVSAAFVFVFNLFFFLFVVVVVATASTDARDARTVVPSIVLLAVVVSSIVVALSRFFGRVAFTILLFVAPLDVASVERSPVVPIVGVDDVVFVPIVHRATARVDVFHRRSSPSVVSVVVVASLGVAHSSTRPGLSIVVVVMTTRDSTTTIERHLSALHRVLLARDVDVGGGSVSSFSQVGGGGGGDTTTTNGDDDDDTARGTCARVPISFASAREYAETYAALALEECEAIARRGAREAAATAATRARATRATREDDVFHVVALDVEDGWDEKAEGGFRENLSLIHI